MYKDLVSIVIPTYNRVNLIQETIDSALSQTYKYTEIIVLDNNSSDNTFSFLNKKYNKNLKVKVYKNDFTLDIVKNWRKCFDYANGKYVHILWSDDLISPEFISKTVEFLECNPSAGFVYTLTEIFNNDKGISKYAFQLKNSGLIDKKVFIEKSLMEPPLSVPVSPANALFRRIDIEKNLLLDIPNNFGIKFSEIGQGNDNLLFLLTLNDYSHFGYIDECHSYFRDHTSSITLSTNSFLVTLRYHIAKSFFVSKSKIENKLIKKFNSKVLLILLVCKISGLKGKIKFKNLYLNNTSHEYKLKYVLYFVFKYVRYKLKYLF